MVLKYFKEYEVKTVGGTKAFVGKEPFDLIGADEGDKISVTVEDNKIIIEKVGKK